jgi:hypothetical protein
MEKEQAIDLLVRVAHLAQQRGLLQLSDAVQVAKAIEVLQVAEDQPEARMQIEKPQPNEVGGGVLVTPRTAGDGRPKK